MHRCLSDVEILDNIFRHIQYKRTLAGLARSCLTFKGCALDVLYEKVSLKDLLRTTSGLSTDYSVYPGFRRPVQPKDTDTLQSYGRRVKELIANDTRDLGDDVADAVCAVRMSSDVALTPSLRSLDWQRHVTHLSILFAFVPRELERLSLPANCLSKRWLPTITSLCPSLTHFTVTRGQHYNVDLAFIAGWSQLQVLACHNITTNTLEYVSSLGLRDFSFFIPDKTWMASVALHPSSFADLRSLGISTAGGFEPIKTLLQRLSLPSLTEVSISVELNDEEGLGSFIELVASRFALRRLEISLNDDRLAGRRVQVRKDAFLPLLGLRDLETLKFEYGLLEMDDQTLDEIAKALPNLRVLSLCNGDSSKQPDITPRGLITLLRRCPKLQMLGLSIDAALVNPLDVVGEGVCNTSIYELTVFNSSIGDPTLVTAFLADVLPSVTEIHACGDSKWYKAWKEVETCLNLFVIVRKVMAMREGQRQARC